MRYQKFGYTTNLTLAEELGIENPKNAVAIYYKRQMLNANEPKFLEKKNDKLNNYEWAVENYLLNVDLYDLHSSLYYTHEHKFLTVLLFNEIDLSSHNSTIAFYRDQLNSLYDDLHLYTFLAIASSDHWKFLPYKLDTQHPVELAILKDQQWYKASDKVMDTNNIFNHDVVVEFVHDVYYNRTLPFVLSEQIPKKPFKNGVMHLVGKNFEEEITKEGQDFFIMFFTTWNPNCAKFRIIMQDLANNEFKDVKNFHFVQMDESKNFVPTKFKVGELPSLYLYKQDYKPMVYLEAKTKEQVLSFIERYSNVYKAHLEEQKLNHGITDL